MIRFWRIFLLLFGLGLFIAVWVRGLQPAETKGLYRVVYGDLHGRYCCASFMINEEKRTANRVQVGVIEQPTDQTPISPSGAWQFAYVQTPRQWVVYLIPQGGGEPLRLPNEVGNSWLMHWGSRSDTLYFLQRGMNFRSALFRATPAAPQPVKITRYIFGEVRSIHEQPLPTTHFTPYGLLFMCINILVIGGALGRKRW